MNLGIDFSEKYDAFLQDAESAYKAAADGPTKASAGLHFNLADSAQHFGNEVDWLLAIHRVIRALE